jgi:glycosyltransferase involved in cell wall biosynthesis
VTGLRPTVVFATNALGMGGTEKGMMTQALALDRERLDTRIVGILDGGPRRLQLESVGLRVDVAGGDPRRLRDLLRGADVVVTLRQGVTEPMLPAACRASGVPHLVEWNMFGQVDASADEAQFACHLFVSKMILLRYRWRVGDLSSSFHNRHRVHELPIDRRLRARAPTPWEAKSRLGLDPARPVVGRVGRAADGKWRTVLIDMVPELLERVPAAQILFVGATAAKRLRLKRFGVLDRCTFAEPTLDEERLATFYAACDVFVSAAEIGESQGLAILEAMGLGVPVVTCSTPWVDNAQVEFVQHGVSGYVANHPAPFAEAVAALLSDESLRSRMGEAARAAVRRLSADEHATQMERLLISLATDGRVPDEWSPSPAEVEAFAGDYRERKRRQLRPLTSRESAQAHATRLRERATQLASAFLDRERVTLAIERAQTVLPR